MDIELQYGSDGLIVEELPDARTTFVNPSHLPGADDDYGRRQRCDAPTGRRSAPEGAAPARLETQNPAVSH
jgi:hypothetical protein